MPAFNYPGLKIIHIFPANIFGRTGDIVLPENKGAGRHNTAVSEKRMSQMAYSDIVDIFKYFTSHKKHNFELQSGGK